VATAQAPSIAPVAEKDLCNNFDEKTRKTSLEDHLGIDFDMKILFKFAGARKMKIDTMAQPKEGGGTFLPPD
jgi:hypothetical protein